MTCHISFSYGNFLTTNIFIKFPVILHEGPEKWEAMREACLIVAIIEASLLIYNN